METKKTIVRKPIKRTKPLSGLGETIYSEAMRYIKNAKDTLNEKANLDISSGVYQDKKYVKGAGHYAYHGILFALNNSNLLTAKKNERLSVEKYQQALGAQNRKMLDLFNSCYQILHLVAGYDGVGKASILKEVFADAEIIIKWCANRV